MCSTSAQYDEHESRMSGTFQVPREAIEQVITAAQLVFAHGREPQFQIGESGLLSMKDSNYIPTLQPYR